MVNALEHRGFLLKRVRGSHHILHDDAGRRVVVPVHGSTILPPGTLGNILGQAGVTVEELIELLKESR